MLVMSLRRRPLPQPFMVVATQNPIEYLGTYPLPESQMTASSFASLWLLPPQEEEKMLLRRGGRAHPLFHSRRARPTEVLRLQDETEKVTVSDLLLYDLHRWSRDAAQPRAAALPVSPAARSALPRHAGDALLHGRPTRLRKTRKRGEAGPCAHASSPPPRKGLARGPRAREVIWKILARVAVPVRKPP